MSLNDVVQFVHQTRAKITFVFGSIPHQVKEKESQDVRSANNSV